MGFADSKLTDDEVSFFHESTVSISLLILTQIQEELRWQKEHEEMHRKHQVSWKNITNNIFV
jgi:hypothetical protein